MDVALISSIGIASSLLFRESWGKVIDYVGGKAVMLACIIPISLLPFVYAISPHVIFIYLYSIVAQISWAGFNIASFVYFSDALPKENSSAYVASYNLITGLASAIAPFFGGIIAQLTSIWFVFILSTLLRFSSIFLLNSLEEKFGLKIKGSLSFGPELFGIGYVLQNFMTTYSLVISETSKRFKKGNLKFILSRLHK